jgi:NAD(P)-dependent dehydrogenase (short-subunit alcohol dehydrogenase family)
MVGGSPCNGRMTTADDCRRRRGQPEGKTFVIGMQALKRIGQPADVGPVVAFLASDAAHWITGDTIRVDGGSRL